MELQVLPSDFGLPCVDSECLQFMAACKFCAAPIVVIRQTRPWTTPKSRYPVFVSAEGNKITDFTQFITYLKTHGNDLVIDGHLSESQRGELYTFSSFIRTQLLPAYLYAIWVDEHNFSCVTNHWFARHLTFPLNQWHVTARRQHATQLLHAMYPGVNVTMKDIEYAVTRQAVTCLNQLSAKLGDRKYFYGDKPSSLDALVFGYVAPLLKLPLANDRIQQHVKACSNLTRFVETIISIYLPLSDEELTRQRRGLADWEMRRTRAQEQIRRDKAEERRQQHAGANDRSQDEGDEFHIRDKIIFGIFAATISVLAALHFGLIKVELSDRGMTDDPVSTAPALPEGMVFQGSAHSASDL